MFFSSEKNRERELKEMDPIRLTLSFIFLLEKVTTLVNIKYTWTFLLFLLLNLLGCIFSVQTEGIPTDRDEECLLFLPKAF